MPQDHSERDAYLLEALAVVTQHLSSGVAVLDATGHVVLVNEPGQRLLGLRATDARSWTEQVAGYQMQEATGRFVAVAERPLARALAGESVLGWEGRLRPPGGLQDTFLVASATPLRDVAANVTGAVGIFSETSLQGRLELDLSGCLGEQKRLLARLAVLERQLGKYTQRGSLQDGSAAGPLAPFNKPVGGPSSCIAPTMLKQIDDDRGRLLDAADVLLAALENARGYRELHHIRGELAVFSANVEHMRHLVERQPNGGLDMWKF